ncbi:MAG: NAD(P)H-dependent oxidoreductase subunit E [Fusobacteriaceae bacterium]
MKLTKNDKEKIKEFIKKIEKPNENLVTVLDFSQEVFGYLPEKVINFLSEELSLEKEKIENIVKRNNYFRKIQKANFSILICKGNRCEKKNPKKVEVLIKEILGISIGEHSSDGIFSLNEVPCIGACKLAPVFTIGKKVYGEKDLLNLKSILEEYRKKE